MITEQYTYYTDERGELQHKINPEFEENRNKKKYEVMLKYSGIPYEYHTLGFSVIKDNYQKSRKNFKHCIKYAVSPDDEKFRDISLYLYGPNTSSKTSLACAIGMQFLKAGKYVKFITAFDLVQLLMERVSWEASSEVHGRVREFDKCDLIIVDDAFDSKKSLVWKGDAKNQIIQLWDGFLRRHLSNHTRFIVTTNVNMAEVALSYSKDIYAQLKRNFYPLEFQDNIENIRTSRFEGIFDK